jgi:short-subunit dehydrogenase
MESSKPTACITGASSGIGAEFARQLAARGYNLILVARRRERLEQLSAELGQKYTVQVECLPADLSVEAEIKRVETRLQQLDNLEILVNNAGFGIPGDFAKTDVDDSLTMLSVHVLAVVRLSRAVLPQMIERANGYIINVSSLSAFSAPLGHPMYAATKSFLNGFSEGLATELHGSGVKVQALCPGMTRTEFHDSPAYARYHDEKVIPKFAWMSTESVVRGSLAALRRNQVIYIPGFGNRLAAAMGSLGLIRVFVWVYRLFTGKQPSAHLED